MAEPAVSLEFLQERSVALDRRILILRRALLSCKSQFAVLQVLNGDQLKGNREVHDTIYLIQRALRYEDD